ncbi:MAG: thioredoxin-like domain-containing protein [Pirellulales bacterium]
MLTAPRRHYLIKFVLSFLVTGSIVIASIGCDEVGHDETATADPTNESTADQKGDPAKGQTDKAGKKPAAQAERNQAERTQVVADGEEHPFERRQPAPSLDGGKEWLNTGGPIHMKDLRGKFVLFDFWTYCCINCLHILPELKKLELAYPNEVVVIGVHSAKFDTEKGSENIRQAILRYEIEHPVVNDADHIIWRKFGISGWPALRVVDPEGNLVAGHGGEVTFEALDRFFKHAIPYYKKRKLLDESPLRFDLEQITTGPLRFPGKVLADEASNRLYITDTGHNRIVVTDLAGKLVDVIGTGQIGADDGAFDKASFDHPHGVAVLDKTLYVADTENHLIRKIDLKGKRVTTIAGLGHQRRERLWPGVVNDPVQGLQIPDRWVGPPKKTALNSPWALWARKGQLYIAMAGPHQIWRMDLDEKEIGPYAGNGREDIVDGPLLPEFPGESGFSAFAQPSGLVGDEEWLYVADTEGSSIRAVPFDPKQEVKTVVGTSELPSGRLFVFGDRDGKGALKTKDGPGRVFFSGDPEDTTGALLQHATGVTLHDGTLYVADTYNSKIKSIDLKTQVCKTLALPVKGDTPVFDEPAGITYADGKLYVADTNNHHIQVIDLNDGNKISKLTLTGLAAPKPPTPKSTPIFAGALRVEVPAFSVKGSKGKIKLAVKLALPEGWKINTLGPMQYRVTATAKQGPIKRGAIGETVLLDKTDRTTEFKIELPLTTESGEDQIEVGLRYFYCREGGEGLCKVGSVVWKLPLKVTADGSAEPISLEHTVK